MHYKVIRKFQDKDNHIYEVGENYPHANVEKKPTKARLKVLSTDDNKYKHSFIEEIKEEKVAES